eukprot:GHVU01222044.1.p1 GENE.GHVU01222044.1~~GHVU01222044.1.p1  ORF type:complete len:182 (-),score=26.87 GHVU01222044.1:104-649(-)
MRGICIASALLLLHLFAVDKAESSAFSDSKNTRRLNLRGLDCNPSEVNVNVKLNTPEGTTEACPVTGATEATDETKATDETEETESTMSTGFTSPCICPLGVSERVMLEREAVAIRNATTATTNTDSAEAKAHTMEQAAILMGKAAAVVENPTTISYYLGWGTYIGEVNQAGLPHGLGTWR